MIHLTSLQADGFKQLRHVEIKFPRKFCALVEGPNEAGKSTLFEAIYFALYGQGLAMRGGGRGSMNSLVCHGSAGAEIELGLSVNDTQLLIKRKIGRRRSAEVVVTTPDGEEPVRGISDVNGEILTRLNYLDGDALLSSCFVQQKKLDHIEGLGRAERQNILLKLLDMERLTKLKSYFKWNIEDDRALVMARGKFRLAQIVRELAEAQARLQRIERHLLIAELRAALEDAEAQAEAAQLARELEENYKAESEQLAAEIKRLEAIDAVLKILEQIGATRRSITAREDDRRSVIIQLENITRLENETLPFLHSELAEVEKLWLNIERIASLEQRRDEALRRAERLQEIVNRANSLAKPRAELTSLEAEREAAAEREKAAHEILELAKRLESIRAEIEQLDREIRQAEEKRDRITATVERNRALARRRSDAEELSGRLDVARAETTDAKNKRDIAKRIEELSSDLAKAEAEINSAAERRARLKRLATQLNEIEELSKAAAEVEEQLALAHSELEEAKKSQQRLRMSQALRQWIAAKRDAEQRANIEQKLNLIREQIEATRTRHARVVEDERAARRLLVIGLCLTVVGIAISAIGFWVLWLLIPVGLACILAGGALSLLNKQRSDHAALERQVASDDEARLEREIHGEEVRRDTLARQSPLEVNAARRELEGIGLEEPKTIEEGERLAEELYVESVLPLSEIEEKQERVQQLERDAITANERLRAQIQSLEGELNREGLLAKEQIAEAIKHVGNEKSQAERRRADLLEEIDTLKHSLPPQSNIESFILSVRVYEQAERELELELARLQETIRIEDEQINRNLAEEGAKDMEEAKSLIVSLEDELVKLKQRREALEEDAKQRAQSLPENYLMSHLKEQFNEASTTLREIELEVKGKRAHLHAEEKRIGNDLAAEGLDNPPAAERAVAESLNTAHSSAGEIDEAWRSDKDALLRFVVPMNTAGAREALTNLRAEINAKIGTTKEQVAKRSSYEADYVRINSEIEGYLSQIEVWRKVLAATAQDANLDIDYAQTADPAKEEKQLLEQARTERRHADLNLFKEDYQRARENRAAEASKAEQAERNRQYFLTSAQNFLLQLGVRDLQEINTENITAQLSEFAEIKPDDRAGLQAERDNMRARLLGLESEAERLELELYIKREELDYDECTRELEEAERRQTICTYAAPILDQVRENILRAVLPSTLDYMRSMLPLLTCGRYHDAELDDETYKIRVWDARAADYVEKEIFSGATQDQFSLALRLAFALATLPEGLGAHPKFIFLDEPTAGFDGERRASFVKLLTEGELAERFDQIFLISPEGIFDSNPLTHHVRIQGGRIMDENISNGVH